MTMAEGDVGEAAPTKHTFNRAMLPDHLECRKSWRGLQAKRGKIHARGVVVAPLSKNVRRAQMDCCDPPFFTPPQGSKIYRNTPVSEVQNFILRRSMERKGV